MCLPQTPVNEHDLKAERKEYHFKPPKWLCQPLIDELKDERDLPMVYLILNILMITLPMAFFVFTQQSHYWGMAYFAVNTALFLRRFILWLHFSAHRPTYKQSSLLGQVLNLMPASFLCAFFGIAPGMYHLHHVMMHHVENNVFPFDVSSTEPFQRDNFLHFVFYWMRFLFAGFIELPFYAIMRRGYKVFAQSVFSEITFFTMLYYLYQFNPMATTWVLIVPQIVTSFGLMFGNWSQHLFIDPNDPGCNHGLTVNCLNHPYNQQTFNDGYHILHHLNSRTHWSELPKKYLETLKEHETKKAIIVDGLWFDDLGWYAMLGRLDWIADRFVQTADHKMSKDEIIELLRQRLKPIPAHQQQQKRH